MALILGEVTEDLAVRFGQAIGGLLNATFGNVVELILSIAGVLGRGGGRCPGRTIAWPCSLALCPGPASSLFAVLTPGLGSRLAGWLGPDLPAWLPAGGVRSARLAQSWHAWRLASGWF